MNNVNMKIEGNKLVIEVDITKSGTVSKSGKSEVIGTTSGFMGISTPTGVVKVSLNVTK